MNLAGKLTRDGWLLFATRCSRMFAYGLLSVVLVLYLVEVGLKEWEVGLLDSHLGRRHSHLPVAHDNG
jgi:hypothetical protein